MAAGHHAHEEDNAHMRSPHRRLAGWLGGGGTRGRATRSRPTLNRPGPQAPWYPPTLPGAHTAEMAAIRAGSGPAPLELAHEEDWQAARPTIPLSAILASWRAQWAVRLDLEWRAWRDLLYTYPAPEEAP